MSDQPGPIDGGLQGGNTSFRKKSFGGDDAIFYHSVPDLRDEKGHGLLGQGNWNDEITSFKVKRGVWRFWEDIEYKGVVSRNFGPGSYEDIRNYGFEKDAASSIELVSEI